MNLRSKYERQGNLLLTEKPCAPQQGFFFCLLPSRSYLECIAQVVNVIPVNVSSYNWHVTHNTDHKVFIVTIYVYVKQIYLANCKGK